MRRTWWKLFFDMICIGDRSRSFADGFHVEQDVVDVVRRC